MKKGRASRLDALAAEGVERADPAGPPTAFRIWRAGMNMTDHGPTVFSERSALLLTEEQTRRGNKYSFDVNHLALDKNAPLESQRAVGWFELEVRNGELWAVNCEFADFIKSGLTKDPPEWRYISPAYEIDVATSEVISLINIALTNNPATHQVTALASRVAKKDRTMTTSKKMSWGELKAALDGDDENMKAAAYAQIAAAFPEHADPDGNEGEEKKDTEDMTEDMKKDFAEEPEKKDAITAALAEVNRLASRVRELEKDREVAERKMLIASRPDFAPELVRILEKAPLSMVREHVEKLPKAVVLPASTEHVQATRGASHVDAEASALPPAEKAALDERMGLRCVEASVKNEGVHQVFSTLTPSQARKASRKAGN